MNSFTQLSKPDVTLSLTLPSPTLVEEGRGSGKPEDRGLVLVQLLLSCAKHVSSGNLHRADAYLRQISDLASVSGNSMQRLAAWFASALAVRLLKGWPGLHRALDCTGSFCRASAPAQPICTPSFPYLGFGYAIITKSLVSVMSLERVVHVIDFGSGDPKLWVPLLRDLARSEDGPPHLRLTCVCNRRGVLEKLGLVLVEEAEIADMPFQFNPLDVNLGELTMEMLDVRSGESLVVVSMLGLHALLAEDDMIDAQFSGLCKSDGVKECRRLSEFLGMIRSLSPKLLFLVEQEADHNTARLIDRFVEGLHYYSAVIDSIDAAFCEALPSEERRGLEEMLGREIENIVSCEGLERKERHEKYAKWAVRLARAGFRPGRLWLDAIEDAGKSLVQGCGREGYKVLSERCCTKICWHERPVYAVSAWIC